MKFIIYLTLLIVPGSFTLASGRQDSTSIRNKVRDSLSARADYYILMATFNSAIKPADAVKSYKKALTTAPVRNELWEADVRTEIGKLLFKLKKDEAIAQFIKAESLYKKQSNLRGRADVLDMLAKIYEKKGMLTEAQKQYTDLYKVHMEAGDAVFAGNVASHLSDVFFKKKNYDAAFSYAAMAKNSYERVCRRDSLGSIYLKIATIKRIQNKPKLAEYYVINKALPYSSSADDFKGRIRSFVFLGNMYKDQKSYSQAKWFYIQANTQSRAIKDTSGIINSLLNLSVVKALIGNPVLAKRDLAEARALAKGTPYSDLTEAFNDRYPTLLRRLGLKDLAAVTMKRSADPGDLPVQKLLIHDQTISPSSTLVLSD
ncbi:hypothetical protein BDE36_3958 [Arcticibacter tournemirensis]|uniref:Tetratricopeptide repeat protein n=1 Tax=Arcticibacter tournemirensis TaxID=699437 RepID=A0A5M9HHY9_9SPHI|nr:hypothetical protein [Arcticibacter tournemirensis]KAA8486340.1 hypothetical protein F1649_01805 [Arcticibacter tournemirensis]TQM52156.1 hypothetical protein BDE36_3958 [Arcticibacter tournemirensis]